MTAYFIVALDTTAPVITWGTPSSTSAGTTLVLPYTINEAGITAARLRDSAGTITAATFNGTEITVEIPEESLNGNAWIEVDVIDALDNSAQREFLFTIDGGVDVSTGGGRGRPFTYGAGGPAFERTTVSIPGELTLLRVTRVSVAAEFSLNRSHTVNLSASIGMQRAKSFSFECERAPAEHFLKIRREDEEILLLCL